MIIYKYDAITKEFDREMTAQKNPLMEGEFLYPPYITTIKPDLVDGYVSIFDEAKQKWNNVIDNRGTTVYNILGGSPSIVDYLGEVKEGFTLVEPTGIYDVNFVDGKWVTDRAGKLRELKEAVNKAWNNLQVVSYGGRFYQADDSSLLRIEGAVKYQTIPIRWRDLDNKMIDLVAQDLIDIMSIKHNNAQLLKNKQAEIEEEIANLTDEEVINFEIKIED